MEKKKPAPVRQQIFSWEDMGSKRVPVLSFIKAAEEFAAFVESRPHVPPLESWREYRQELAGRLFMRCVNEPGMDPALVQEWLTVAAKKRVLFYCADEAPTKDCATVDMFTHSDTGALRMIHGVTIPSPAGFITLPVSELERIQRQVAKKRLLDHKPETYYIFITLLVSVYKKCCVVPLEHQRGKNDPLGVTSGSCLSCTNWNSILGYAPATKEEKVKKSRTQEWLSPELRERMERKHPTQQEHIDRMLHPQSASYIPVQGMVGLGFLPVDSPMLRLAPRCVPDHPQWLGGMNYVPDTALPCAFLGRMYWEEPVLGLRLDTMTCPRLPVASPQKNLSVATTLSTGMGPYLFHWKDAPGVAHPQEDAQWVQRTQVSEDLVLLFLRTLCTLDYAACTPQADCTFRGMERAGLLQATADSPHRVIPPEMRDELHSPLFIWNDRVSDHMDPEWNECLQGRRSPVIYHAERYCTWFLLYVFCHSEPGMKFFQRALGLFWRGRLRAEHDMQSRINCLRQADMEHLLDEGQWEPSLLENLEDRMVTCASERLARVAPLAARCFLAQESGLPTSFNTLFLRCRRVFLEWHPEVCLAAVEEGLAGLAL